MNHAGQGLGLFGVLALLTASEPVLHAAARHWSDPSVDTIASIPTYLSEIFVETDYIFIEGTLLAWLGPIAIGLMVASILVRAKQRRDGVGIGGGDSVAE